MITDLYRACLHRFTDSILRMSTAPGNDYRLCTTHAYSALQTLYCACLQRLAMITDSVPHMPTALNILYTAHVYSAWQ